MGTGPFQATHSAFTSVDEIDWQVPLGLYDETTRELGRRAFQARALDEQRSLVAFSDVLAMLTRSGAPIDVIGSMTRVVRDEASHVDLCNRMVQRLGGWDDEASAPSFVSLPAKWSPKQRIFATVLGSLCIGETISVALFQRARTNATDPLAKQVLTRMLADESFHSRFGWWWLDSIPRSAGAQGFAEHFVGQVLGSVVNDFLPTQTDEALAEKSLPRNATPFGGISASERRDAVVDAVRAKIVPGFERAGIPAKALWQKALDAENNERDVAPEASEASPSGAAPSPGRSPVGANNEETTS